MMKNRKDFALVGAILFTAIAFAWLGMAQKAEAHVVTVRDCGNVAAIYPRDLRGGVRTTCVRLAAKHARAHEYRGCLSRATTIGRNKCVIRLVFGIWGGEAVSVAGCESTWNTRASNGQYLGLFQMGSAERARYGHGPTALQQSISAYSYFIASGSDWSPWACRP